MGITKPPVLPPWADAGDKVQPTNAELSVGWPVSSTPPSRQRFNWVLNFVSNAVRYFSRRGLVDYDPNEIYMTGDRVIGDDGKTYRSLVINNTAQTPSTSPTKWERWGFTQSELSSAIGAAGNASGTLITALNQNFAGLTRSLTPIGGGLVREYVDIPNAATVGGIEIGQVYNCAIDPITGVWGGRDVQDICWLEKWHDTAGTKEIWFAVSGATGTAPVWRKAFSIGLDGMLYQDNNIKDMTAVTTPYAIGIGQAAIYKGITIAPNGLLPLNLSCGTDMVFEVYIAGSAPAPVNAGSLLLYPNDINYGNIFTYRDVYTINTSALGSFLANCPPYFSTGGAHPKLLTGTIMTTTTAKRWQVQTAEATTITNYVSVMHLEWSDTTTVWSSLGSLKNTNPAAFTGTIIVKRVA